MGGLKVKKKYLLNKFRLSKTVSLVNVWAEFSKKNNELTYFYIIFKLTTFLFYIFKSH